MIKNSKSYFMDFFQDKNEEAISNKNKIELATAVLMIEISLADDNFSNDEYITIKKILLSNFELEETEIDELIKIAKQETDNAVSLYEFTETLNNELSTMEKNNIIENLWRVAYADSYIDKYEEYYIRKIADLLHISHSNYIKAKLEAAKQ